MHQVSVHTNNFGLKLAQKLWQKLVSEKAAETLVENQGRN